MTEDEKATVNFPWIPDIIQAYKFGLCSLCKEEKTKDKEFDNKNCPHCQKLTKVFSWMGGSGKK